MKNMAFALCLFLLVTISSRSVSASCNRCPFQGKAAFFSRSSPLSSGACGYGSMALEFNKGFLAAGVPSLYKDGAGCGGCFQVRCKDKSLCNLAWTPVFLSDLNQSNRTEFVLSSKAFAAMAAKGKASDLLNRGTVDIEYKRVPCEYPNRNLSVRVEESSRNPYYLAIKFLYQGGQTEIVAVYIATANSTYADWRYLSRNHGAIWTTSTVPAGALQFRLVVTGGYDGKNLWAKGSVLPADWRNGVIYDSGIQITDVAQDGCSPCQ